MIYNLAQLFGNGDSSIMNILYFLFIFVFIFYGSRLMLMQTVWKLEKDVAQLEEIARKAKGIVAKRISKRPSKDLRDNISMFTEFFTVSPVTADPYGIIKKIDHVVRQADRRFKYFVNQIAPDFSSNEKADIKNALAGAMTTHQIAKIARHFLETIKKYKIFQLALLLQMQIPLIKRYAEAALGATQAFVDELPIGDSVGPLVVANLIPARTKVRTFKEEEFSVAKVKIGNKSVFVTKAHGPGAGTGFPGKFLTKFVKRNRIHRIITVDAALKLEGEKVGSLAEGVGVAMGGTGVERYEIEEFAVKKNVPLDAVAVKMDEKEALTVMKREVVDAVPGAIELVKRAVKRSGPRERIMVIGVGNTCGVGNNIRAAKEAEDRIRKYQRKKKAEEKNKKK